LGPIGLVISGVIRDMNRRERMDDALRPKHRQSAKDRALGLLAVRWRSREELRRRLRQAGFEPEETERALTDLTTAGLIEDGRFARELVRDQAGRRLSGDRAIRGALRVKGVPADLAETALLEAGDEAQRARELATRRAMRMGSLAPEAAYRRLYGLLMRRGFPPGLAVEACRAALAQVFPHSDAEPADG
jgi:regulatory protein